MENEQQEFVKKIYYNKYGPYVIDEYLTDTDKTKSNQRIKVRIRFLNTGFETITSLEKAIDPNNAVKDGLVPTVGGVGMLGYGGNDAPYKLRKAWGDMIRMCYDKSNSLYNKYGALGVSVCDRWLRRDNFLEDAVHLPGYEDMISNPNVTYSLDKDKLQYGLPTDQKQYSPETCEWVPYSENSCQVLIDHAEESKINHIGINLTHGNTYNVRIRGANGGSKINYGNYTNLDAAIAISNYAFELKGSPIRNTPEYEMSVHEAIQYRSYPVGKDPVIIVKKIEK